QYALEKINSGEAEENITDENKDKLIRCELFQREFINGRVKEKIDFLQKTLREEKNKLKSDPGNFDLKIEIGKTCYTLGKSYQDQKNAKDSLI
ncbi:hypothetical protein, partial [Pseudomonas viridiflava]|uniref:hypothetical protein n=1 Tax=Pseudomonas viridiflava TaxID=33069 RepID=UPI0013DFD84A